MVFPGPAPARMVVAARSGSTRRLQQRLDRARAHGVSDQPTIAAAQILALVGALHAHDRRTRGHAERVRTLTELVATELRLDADSRDRLRWASLLHDIGKLEVPRRILNKPGSLNAKEWVAIHRHPADGARIAAPLAAWLGPWSRAIAEHHERYDGTGYPLGLSGDDISEGARIVAVADAFEVMTAARAYKRAMSPALACQELATQAGTQFDERVVAAFLAISFTRLRWLTGPVAWVAQLPILGWLPRVLAGTGALGTQAAGIAGVAALAGASTVATPALASAGSVIPLGPPVPPAASAPLGPAGAVHRGSAESRVAPTANHDRSPAPGGPSASAATTASTAPGHGSANGSSGNGSSANSTGAVATFTKGNANNAHPAGVPAVSTSSTLAPDAPKAPGSGHTRIG